MNFGVTATLLSGIGHSRASRTERPRRASPAAGRPAGDRAGRAGPCPTAGPRGMPEATRSSTAEAGRATCRPSRRNHRSRRRAGGPPDEPGGEERRRGAGARGRGDPARRRARARRARAAEPRRPRHRLRERAPAAAPEPEAGEARRATGGGWSTRSASSATSSAVGLESGHAAHPCHEPPPPRGAAPARARPRESRGPRGGSAPQRSRRSRACQPPARGRSSAISARSRWPDSAGYERRPRARRSARRALRVEPEAEPRHVAGGAEDAGRVLDEGQRLERARGGAGRRSRWPPRAIHEPAEARPAPARCAMALIVKSRRRRSSASGAASTVAARRAVVALAPRGGDVHARAAARRPRAPRPPSTRCRRRGERVSAPAHLVGEPPREGRAHRPPRRGRCRGAAGRAGGRARSRPPPSTGTPMRLPELARRAEQPEPRLRAARSPGCSSRCATESAGRAHAGRAPARPRRRRGRARARGPWARPPARAGARRSPAWTGRSPGTSCQAMSSARTPREPPARGPRQLGLRAHATRGPRTRTWAPARPRRRARRPRGALARPARRGGPERGGARLHLRIHVTRLGHH